MKQTRLKRAARILNVYRHNFGHTPPYCVLLDGTCAQTALTEKINLQEQLPKYLGAPVEIFTTSCVLAELEKLGSPVYGALSICKQQSIHKCPHKPARSAAECLAHLARRSTKKDGNKFMFATQDPSLTEKLREMAGVPIIYVAFKTVLLDPVSQKTKDELEKPSADLEAVKELKKALLGEAPAKKKRKKKGVNPLSCKKKVLKADRKASDASKTANGKRRRKKKSHDDAPAPAQQTPQ